MINKLELSKEDKELLKDNRIQKAYDLLFKNPKKRITKTELDFLDFWARDTNNQKLINTIIDIRKHKKFLKVEPPLNKEEVLKWKKK